MPKLDNNRLHFSIIAIASLLPFLGCDRQQSQSHVNDRETGIRSGRTEGSSTVPPMKARTASKPIYRSQSTKTQVTVLPVAPSTTLKVDIEKKGDSRATKLEISPSKKNAPSKATRKPSRELTRAELSRLPLVQKENLQYIGGFRLPSGKHGVSSFDYGGTALAFNPAGPSLFMVGHDHQQAIGEVSIPATFSKSKQVRDLPTASCLQHFVDIRSRIPKSTLSGNVKIGGLMIADGKLIGTQYVFYDAEARAQESHFRLDSLDLANARVEGLFRVGTMGGGWVGGYMTEVPEEWRAALGTRYLTGQGALSIITRTSFGPAAFGFDPGTMGAAPAKVTPLVYYTQKNPLGNLDKKNPHFNGTTAVNGICFAPGTRSVLFIGSHGTSDVVYGEADEAKDPHRRDKGYHSRNGDYQYQVWAYDVNDFVSARTGKVQPWQLRPYAVWDLNFSIDVGGKRLGGVAFDPETNRLYVSQLHADEWGLPLVQGFELNAK